jgi:hypothetical protein
MITDDNEFVAARNLVEYEKTGRATQQKIDDLYRKEIIESESPDNKELYNFLSMIQSITSSCKLLSHYQQELNNDVVEKFAKDKNHTYLNPLTGNQDRPTQMLNPDTGKNYTKNEYIVHLINQKLPDDEDVYAIDTSILGAGIKKR